MHESTRLFLSWALSKLGRNATLGQARTILDKNRGSTRIGRNYTLDDVSRKEVHQLLVNYGEGFPLKSLKTQAA